MGVDNNYENNTITVVCKCGGFLVVGGDFEVIIATFYSCGQFDRYF